MLQQQKESSEKQSLIILYRYIYSRENVWKAAHSFWMFSFITLIISLNQSSYFRRKQGWTTNAPGHSIVFVVFIQHLCLLSQHTFHQNLQYKVRNSHYLSATNLTRQLDFQSFGGFNYAYLSFWWPYYNHGSN